MPLLAGGHEVWLRGPWSARSLAECCMNAGGLADCSEDVEVMGLGEACCDSCLLQVFPKWLLQEALHLREVLLMQPDCRRFCRKLWVRRRFRMQLPAGGLPQRSCLQ